MYSDEQDLIEDQDAAIWIIEQQRYKNALNNAEMKSMAPSATPYKTERKKKKEENKRIAKAFICAAVISLSISVPVKNKIYDNKVQEIASAISIPITNNKIQGNVNPETGTPYWWYDTYHMFEDIDNQNDYSTESKIFSYYLKLRNEYNGMKTLNDIIVHMTGLTSFEEYLKSVGYSIDNLKEWYKDMSKELLELNNSNSLEFQESSMRGR